VYVVDEAGTVEVRPVVVGPSSGEDTLIESGIQAGERLVLEGTDRLRDGGKVEVLGEGPAPEATAVPVAAQTEARNPA
jgi:multidrug efflux system membrane fusion protein